MASNIENLTSSNFQATIEGATTPVLVDFWAQWCGPCKQIAPMLVELATEMSATLKVCKVDVDTNQQLAAEYGIRAIPTLLVFKGGAKVEEVVGMISKADLKSRLAKHTG